MQRGCAEPEHHLATRHEGEQHTLARGATLLRERQRRRHQCCTGVNAGPRLAQTILLERMGKGAVGQRGERRLYPGRHTQQGTGTRLAVRQRIARHRLAPGKSAAKGRDRDRIDDASACQPEHVGRNIAQGQPGAELGERDGGVRGVVQRHAMLRNVYDCIQRYTM